MKTRKILFGALIAALAGCSLIPSYQRPVLPTAALYPGADTTVTQTSLDIEKLGWREFFTDARLQELIIQALENNRDLRIAIRRVEEARGLYGIQRADITILMRHRDQNRNALTLLVGVPLTTFETRPLSLIETGFVQEISAGLPSDLLMNRPDILAAEHRLKAANANIGAARAAFFPRIVLTGNLGSASVELNNLFGAGSTAWSFSPSLTLPIFEGAATLLTSMCRKHAAIWL